MSFRVKSVLEYDRFIAVDIGAFKVKALICSIESGELTILGSASVRQSKKNMLDGDITDLRGVADAIKKAILKAGEHLESIPDDIIVSLPTDTLLYDTVSMNYVRQDRDAPITMEEIDTIVSRTEGKSFERIKAKAIERTGITDSEMKLVTTSVTSITLDGKKVSNPVGFTGKNIKLGIINLFVPISRFSSVKRVISDCKKNLISVVPLAITLPKLLENTGMALDANLFLDIGYSKTTLTLVNDSEILGCHILPFGFSLLEDELKHRHAALSHLDIERIFLSLSEHAKTYSDVFEPFFKLLFEGVYVSVVDIEKQAYLKNVLLSGGGASEYLAKELA